MRIHGPVFCICALLALSTKAVKVDYTGYFISFYSIICPILENNAFSTAMQGTIMFVFYQRVVSCVTVAPYL